jgi:outer membrane immunogenic protein
LALVVAGSAGAADLAPITKAPVAAPSWTGVYLGITAGGAFGHSNHISHFFGSTTLDGYNTGGALVGGTVGYNRQWGRWVYGVEGDVSWSNVQGVVNDFPPFVTTTIVGATQDWLATGRGRLGWTTPNSLLLYLTGGFAVADIEAFISHPTAEVAQTNTRWGWTVGAGAEAQLIGNWSAKAEYLYVNLQSSSYFDAPPPGFVARADVPFAEHVLRFGLNYRFGGDRFAWAPAASAPASLPTSWAGFYLGAQAGGVFGNSNQIDAGPLGFGPTTHGYKITGALAGGTAGYNWQAGCWVWGLEQDIAWADLQGSASEIAPFTATTQVGTKEHWLATGRGRLGWTTPDNVLLYATGGVAAADVEAVVTALGPPFLSQTNARWGWTVGAGGEALLAGNWSAKAEYLYVKLQSSSYFTSPPAGFNIRGDVPVDEHVFRFGVNYHFGRP